MEVEGIDFLIDSKNKEIALLKKDVEKYKSIISGLDNEIIAYKEKSIAADNSILELSDSLEELKVSISKEVVDQVNSVNSLLVIKKKSAEYNVEIYKAAYGKLLSISHNLMVVIQKHTENNNEIVGNFTKYYKNSKKIIKKLMTTFQDMPMIPANKKIGFKFVELMSNKKLLIVNKDTLKVVGEDFDSIKKLGKVIEVQRDLFKDMDKLFKQCDVVDDQDVIESLDKIERISSNIWK